MTCMCYLRSEVNLLKFIRIATRLHAYNLERNFVNRKLIFVVTFYFGTIVAYILEVRFQSLSFFPNSRNHRLFNYFKIT